MGRFAQQTTRNLVAHNEQTLTALSTVFATVSYTFRRAKATCNCVQLCTSHFTCAHPQPSGCHKGARDLDLGHYNLSTQVLRHVLVEGGATNPDFCDALDAALGAVQVAVSPDCRLAQWTSLFDDLKKSLAKPECLKGEAVDLSKGTLLGLRYPQHVGLQRSVQKNERKLRAKFPNFAKGIRTFHQNLMNCHGEYASLLVILNIERLNRLLNSPQYSKHHSAPLLEINTLIEGILQSIPGQSRKLTGRVFAWLSWAKRPLNIEELGAALRIGWDFPPTADSPKATHIR